MKIYLEIKQAQNLDFKLTEIKRLVAGTKPVKLESLSLL